jgi:hypothetical protein
MGSADDDDELEPKRPKPTYQVSHPTLAWESRTETIRAKSAPTPDHEPNPQEPNDSHKNLPPRFELKEIDQLREREAQTAPSTAPATETPPVTENAARPAERPSDYGELHRTHEVVRLDAAAVEMQRTLERYQELRRAEGITPSPDEVAKRHDLAMWHRREELVLQRQQEGDRSSPAYQGEQAKWMDGQHQLEQSVTRVLHRASEVGVEGEWLARNLDATNKPEAERCRREADLGAVTAQEAREQQKALRDTLASVLEPHIYQHPRAEAGTTNAEDAERLVGSVEAREKFDRPSPSVPRERSEETSNRYESINPRVEHCAEATAPAYRFDDETEAFIAARVKDLPEIANKPETRLELAFQADVTKTLDPKGPPFEHWDAGGFLDDAREKFFARHSDAQRSAKEQPAHVREAEDKKSADQEAAKGGRTLTAAEQAHASPQLKTTLDRKEREKRAIEMIRSRSDGRGGRDDHGGGGKGRGGGRGR